MLVDLGRNDVGKVSGTAAFAPFPLLLGIGHCAVSACLWGSVICTCFWAMELNPALCLHGPWVAKASSITSP